VRQKCIIYSKGEGGGGESLDCYKANDLLFLSLETMERSGRASPCIDFCRIVYRFVFRKST